LFTIFTDQDLVEAYVNVKTVKQFGKLVLYDEASQPEHIQDHDLDTFKGRDGVSYDNNTDD